MNEWFDNDSFWIETYPFMFPEKRFQDTEEQIDNILQLIEFKGTSILDLCCGPGRCSIALAKKGYFVTGVDKTGFLLKKAIAKAKVENLSIGWIKDDMRNFKHPDSYDLILSMFTSFGYFDDKNEDIEVLKNIFSNLKSGGKCLIDVMGKERIAKILQPTTSETLDDGSMMVQKHRIFDDWTRIENEWIIVKNGKAESFKFHHTVYSGQELKNLFEKVGFVNTRLYGDLEGRPYGSEAQRLIIVGEKPDK
ncbi:MAG TPA: class I SAM-dependent methyltransferase [Victivallales bacterium]|nr:class I SAM-dependent methyltransferase [Victivallales bacterium]